MYGGWRVPCVRPPCKYFILVSVIVAVGLQSPETYPKGNTARTSRKDISRPRPCTRFVFCHIG